VYPVLSVSLGCSFLIAPSVFSDVYVSMIICQQLDNRLWPWNV